MKKINKTNKTTMKWAKTGLLDGLSGIASDRCAKSLEKMANFLINKSKRSSSDDEQARIVAGTMLPIIRRLYNNEYADNLVVPPKALYDDYIKFLTPDMEAKMCELYANDYIKRYIKQFKTKI